MEKILGQKSGSKSALMAKLWHFLQGHPKPAFSERKQRRPREIFQKSPKKKPSFERLKTTLAQITLSSIYYALKVLRLEKILAQKGIQKCPNG